MINKQSLWFVTLFSLILVLSIYYVTMNDSSLQKVLEDMENTAPVSVQVEESSLLVALRVEEDENVLKEMEDYQNILLDTATTSEEKNNAYNSLMALNSKKMEEEKIEKKIKTEFNFDSFVKVQKDTISIVISSSNHDSALANKIMRSVQELYETTKYITIKFQNA